MKLIVFTCLFLFGFVAARFDSSSSESCEDSHSHSHGSHSHEHGGGGGGGANRGCGRGWRRFNRPSGGWCIKVAQGQFSQAQAESKCQVEGGTLSGLQDTNEISYIASTALRLFPERTGSLWVGARRTPACSSSPISASCNAMNSFTWTDGSTSGTAGFRWNKNQPDNAHSKTQQCVVLLASSTQVVTDSWTWNTNQLDDVRCVNPGGSQQRIVRGYVCGKRATERRRK